jgi:hypothetical protein
MLLRSMDGMGKKPALEYLNANARVTKITVHFSIHLKPGSTSRFEYAEFFHCHG